MRASLYCTVVIVVATWALGAARPPRTFPKRVGGPAVTFTETAVIARGATPGASLYFAGVTLGTGDYVIRVEKSGGTAIADGDGHAELTASIDTRSVWIVVDAASGGYTVAAPHGMLLREIDFPGRSDEDSSGHVRSLVFERYAVDAFLIRPGVGTWTGYLRDGGPGDEDREINGKTDVDLGSLAPVGETQGSADRLKPGDVLFVVDRNTLEFHVLKRGN